MSEWEQTTLGDLFTVDNTKLGPHVEEPTVLSLSKYDGFVRADDYFDKRIASSKLDGYKIVEPGEWAFSTIHIDEGSIARNNLGKRGVISPMYTTMRFVSGDCIPQYAELMVRIPSMLTEYSRRAQGSINRRRSLPFKSFAEIAIVLPSLAEQRRIVDVMTAVDAQAAALEAEVSAACRVLKARRAEFVASPRNDVVKAERAFGILMGRQRSPQRAKGPNMTPYLRSANVGDGELSLGDVKEMDFDGGEQKRYALRVGDVLVSEGSASANAVGMTAVYGGELDGVVCFQNTLLRYRGIKDVSTSSFTNHWCKWAYESGMFRDAASGTNIRHIGSKRAVTMPVALPTLDEQHEIGEDLDSLEAAWLLRRTELAHLRSFRSALLTSLLTQDMEIPESYDALLEEVT